MTIFVLVHGGWGGGWRWQEVSGRLRTAGHETYTPTLTGLGERVHLARPDVDLDTHVLDVVNVLEAEDLQDVVLVGHSYGGMVITGVAERAAHRIAHLIYLDAFVPNDGESLLDLLQPEARRAMEEALHDSDDGWRVRWPGDATPKPWPRPTPRDTPQPWQTFAQPLAATNRATALPRTYVRATADKTPGTFITLSFATSFQRARAGGWRLLEADADHDGAAYSAPAAALLLELFPADA